MAAQPLLVVSAVVDNDDDAVELVAYGIPSSADIGRHVNVPVLTADQASVQSVEHDRNRLYPVEGDIDLRGQDCVFGNRLFRQPKR